MGTDYSDTFPLTALPSFRNAFPDQSKEDLPRDLEKDIPQPRAGDLEKGAPKPQAMSQGPPGPPGPPGGGPQKPKDPNLIGYDGPTDPYNPQNWPKPKKYVVTFVYSAMTFCLTFSSSVFSTATVVTAAKFHVSEEVMVLGTSLYVLGFAGGPIVWGPVSEL